MPIAGQVVVGYVGKSRQTVKQREEQHRDCQPFSDTIVGGSWTIEEGWWTDAELDAREQYYIKHGVTLAPGQAPQRPVYNYEFNTDNPDRIEIWRAVEHRQRREPGWVPPPKDRVPRPRRASGPQTPTRASRSRLARWWDRRRWWVSGLAVLWLAFFAVGLRGSWLLWDELRIAPAAAVACAPFAVVWGSIGYARVRRWWRRVTRPRRRRR
ncbi:hypothetical protein O7626_40175 [Micromonospora sp. WMMD1102]|uniref:hypothetical protein n=1 Tax=Micromonospora sp. WMMD1102 TaxID=3016105 RepID=UPI002414EC62|nr:hypothetical protein [Micromonospora sp. WMMD1102]MDG4792035.1 hypothetical protein [Micromonospora sp. WMMD1102]